MGLGRLLTRRQEHTRAITEFAIIDGVAVDGSGQFANRYRGTMAVPGAWRASLLLSDLLGGAPWDAFRKRGRTLELIEPTPLLLEQPNPPDARMTTFSSWGLDLIYHGNAIGVVTSRNAEGWPASAMGVPADQVGVRRVTPFMNSPLPVGALEYSFGGLRRGSQDVIHIKGPCEPGALRGMGVLEAHQADALSLAREQMNQAKSVSQHGVPTGVLESSNPDLTDKEAQDLKRSWLENQRSRTVAVLNASTKFTPLSWNPEELQLVEARRYTLTDLELIFGLPVGWLGGMNSARQYSNIEQDAVNLLKFSLGGHLARFEQTLSLHMPRGNQAKANLDWLLRPDTLTRYEAHKIALTNKFLTLNEVRELENRPPLPPKPEPVPSPVEEAPSEEESADDE